MILKGEFSNKDNIRYSVQIDNGIADSKEIIIGQDGIYFAAEPITIEEDIDSTFETIIRKSCTINLLTENFLGGELYAGNSRNIRVNVRKEGNIIFAGYVEPNTFSQPFVSAVDEFSINCTDALSTLQYYKYKDTTLKTFDEVLNNAKSANFKDMLVGMFAEFNALDIQGNNAPKILYDMSKGVAEGKEGSIFNDLAISELYLLGEDFDSVWSNEDLLKEMLQYLNLHIRQEGLNFYIFDWNTIKDGRSAWVNIVSGEKHNFVPSNITISAEHYADSDTSISVGEVYNQISVNCTLENQDTLIDNPLSDAVSHFKSKQLYMTEYISEGSGDDANDAFNNMVKGKPTKYEKAGTYDWYLQNMYHPNWKLKDAELMYSKNEQGEYVEQQNTARYLKEHSLTPAMFRIGNIKKQENATDNRIVSKIPMSDYLYISINGNEDDSKDGHFPSDSYLKDNAGIIEYTGKSSGGVFSPVDNDTTNYLVFSGKLLLQPICYESTRYIAARVSRFDDILKYSARKTEGKAAVVPDYTGDATEVERGRRNIVKSDNNREGRYYTRKFYRATNSTDSPTYLAGGTGIQVWTDDKSAHGYEFQYSGIGDDSDKISKLPILECELQVGGKYCVETRIGTEGDNSSTFEWLTIEDIKKRPELKQTIDGKDYYKTTFSLGINPKISNYIIGDEFDLQNTIDYTMNLDVEGTAIPIRHSDALSGTMKFKILSPIQLIWNDISATKRDFSFWKSTKWYKNSKYILAHTENIIIKDFKCSIVSDFGKKNLTEDKDLVYSSAEVGKFINNYETDFKLVTQLSSNECFVKGVNAGVLLNAVFDDNTKLPITQLYNATTNEVAKAEEHYIDAYYKEYSKPKVVMECSFIDGSNIDFKNKYYSETLKKHFTILSISRNIVNNSVNVVMKEI
ncbi:hypothetical protein [Prevotella pallens]